MTVSKKKNTDNKIIFDNDILLSSVMFDVCGAESNWFLNELKSSYNVALIPAWHRLYCWELKASWYKWLNNKKWILSLVLPSSWTWITLCSKEFSCMWEIIWIKEVFDLDFIKKFWIKLSDSWFDNIVYDLPYPRVLSEYNEVYIFKVWEKISKKKLNEFFEYLYSMWNVVFLSDLHSWLPLDECTKKDELTLNWEKDIVAFNWFFSLADSKKKKAKFVWYINSADINWNNKSTTGFCTMVF